MDQAKNIGDYKMDQAQTLMMFYPQNLLIVTGE
jgi:hypothetical protein